MGGSGPFGESSGGPHPIAVENFHALRQRQTSDEVVDPADTGRRVNLLNWDGKGAASDLMPPAHAPAASPRRRRIRHRRERRMSGTGDRRLARTRALQAAALCSTTPTTPCSGTSRCSEATAAALPADGRRYRWPRFVDHLRATEPGQLSRDYVETFDLRRRCCLYLTYYAHGDTRKRGMALLQFTHAYRTAGVTLVDGELPDHLGAGVRSRRARHRTPA